MEFPKHLQGQTIDRYTLTELIGATECSSVFRTACNEAPNRQAAIKLVPAPAGTSGAQLTRWRLAARFSHPALLRIFDMGRCELNGRPMLYVVMEYAEENLAEILPVRCLSPGETNAVLAPALSALGYLHGKGFVHGHLQPSNILAIGDQVKLSSDAIARIDEAADPRDPRDPYRAPEIDLSAASDIWSLGITLIQCLTGRVPERDPAGHRSVFVPADVPAPFLELARHCLNPIPQRRWGVAQLQSALLPGTSPAAPIAVAASAADSIPAPDSASPSAFVKPNAVPPVRRGFRLKRKYRFALAALAAATAAFVFGIVISGNTADTTVTASAPLAAVAAPSQTGAAEGNPGVDAQLNPRAGSSIALAENSRDLATGSRRAKFSKSEARDEKSSPVQFAGSENANPAVIIASAAPAAATSPSSVSSDLMPGAVSRRALPRIPASASNTITGTVRVGVIVDVDTRGRIVEAKFDSSGPSRYFARLSMTAAQDWKFTPPRVDGKLVPSEWIINFGYTKTGASATATERHP